MGYTCGRKHTEDSLRELAKLYNTRTDFQKNDSGAYSSAKKRGKFFLNSICVHMLSRSYSTPQLICKTIMEKLLNKKCLYNTRSIIKPYELDVYFKEFKLAFEYNGRGWHIKDDVIKRDNIKKELCDENGITLIIIKENNRDYEKDVKTQLISHLHIINKITNSAFSSLDVENVECFEVYDDILKMRNIEEIRDKIKGTSSIKEFRDKYGTEYNFLLKNKKLKLLDCIRQTKEDSEEELLEKCKKISNYSIFIRDNFSLYQKCIKRNLIEKATSHMDKANKRYRNHTNEELLDLANKFQMKTYLKRGNTPLYLELKKRNILNMVVYEPNFVYKHTNKITKELKLNKCFEEAKKYDNYEDFKNDEELYNTCVNYKIIRKIIDTFPKNNIEEIILKESKKYKNFKEFTNTVWYKKTKTIKGLIQKIKKENNWSFFSNTEPLFYIKKFPKIVEMINQGIESDKIIKTLGVDRNAVSKTKRQMHDNGILKVGYRPKKR
jgi:hypothetical protein